MLKAYQYRLYPNAQQKQALAQAFGCARFIYNNSLSYKKEQYENHKNNVSCFDLNNRLKSLKEEYPWLKDVPSQTLQISNQNLDNGFKHFFRRCKNVETPGYPKYKKKFDKQSISFPQHVFVLFKENKIQIPKIGKILAVLHRKFEGKIKTCTVSKTKTDKYFISVLVEDGKDFPEKLPGKTIALDLGIKDFITFSDGNKIKGFKFYNNKLKKLNLLNKKFSKKKKGSNNRNKL